MQFMISINPEDWDGSPVTMSRAPNGDVILQGLPTGPDVAQVAAVDDPVVSEIWGRWRKQKPASGCFRLVEELKNQGLAIVTPKSRRADKAVEPYLRVVTKSAAGTRVSAYINTESLIVTGALIRDTAAALDGATVHPDKSVYFAVDDVDNCLEVMRALLAI